MSVSGRIRAPIFDPPGIAASRAEAYERGTIHVSPHHCARSFRSGVKAPIGVHRACREGAKTRRVSELTRDEGPSDVGELAVRSEQQRRRLHDMKAGARLVREWASHERHRETGAPGRAPQHILGTDDRVREADRREQTNVELILAWPDLGMYRCDRYTTFGKDARSLQHNVRAASVEIRVVVRAVDRFTGGVEEIELEFGAEAHLRREFGFAIDGETQGGSRIDRPWRTSTVDDGTPCLCMSVTEVDHRRRVGPQTHVGLQDAGATFERGPVEREAVGHCVVECSLGDH